jgi:hypothetical protein
MNMNKKIFLIGFLILICSLVFASPNNVTKFSGHWDPNNNQVVFNLACSYQTIANLTISPLGATRTAICPTVDLGQTWAGLGGFSTENVPTNMTVTVEIPQSCDTCSRTITINSPSENQSEEGIPSWVIYAGILVVIVVIGIFVVNSLKR